MLPRRCGRRALIKQSDMELPSEILTRCWFLAGPTACGKSEVALELAARIDAEIVSLDSMTLYKGMDIGTAKPSRALRALVPHHLIDIIEPHEEYSLAEYVTAAGAACREILGRGRTPLFVGGTGLYLRGLLRGVFDGPPADWEFRRRLEAEAGELGGGAQSLHERLRAVDPAAARVLHPRDVRRLVRALEVHHLTGRPLSEQQRQLARPVSARPRHVFWLFPPRKWLYEHIDRRVEEMFARGLVEEVRGLLAAERPLGRTAHQALGYKEVIDLLRGGCDRESAMRQVQTRTRQFAKRQHTWFRHLEECRPVPITGDEPADGLAARILAETPDPNPGLPQIAESY